MKILIIIIVLISTFMITREAIASDCLPGDVTRARVASHMMLWPGLATIGGAIYMTVHTSRVLENIGNNIFYRRDIANYKKYQRQLLISMYSAGSILASLGTIAGVVYVKRNQRFKKSLVLNPKITSKYVGLEVKYSF